MDVYLGGLERFVAEKFLNDAERCASFKQVSGETVAQGVGRDGLQDSGGGRKVADDIKYHDPRHLSSPTVEEDYV